MLMSCEKSIISKGFISNSKYKNQDKNNWSFYKINDSLSQINLRLNNETYTFSFPLHDVHYSTTFKNKSKLKKYINYILQSNIF